MTIELEDREMFLLNLMLGMACAVIHEGFPALEADAYILVNALSRQIVDTP